MHDFAKTPRPARTQAQRRAETRNALVDAARSLFVAKGYAATSTPEIVAAARVTRGALYHHFADKTDLFKAVAMTMAHEVAAAVERRAAHAPTATPRRLGAGVSLAHDADAERTASIDALRTGARGYFAAMAEGGRARTLLVEAPHVLAPADLIALNDASGAAALRAGLKAALGPAGTSAAHLQALTDLLSAAFDRAAWRIASGQPAARYVDAIDRLIVGVVCSAPRPMHPVQAPRRPR